MYPTYSLSRLSNGHAFPHPRRYLFIVKRNLNFLERDFDIRVFSRSTRCFATVKRILGNRLPFSESAGDELTQQGNLGLDSQHRGGCGIFGNHRLDAIPQHEG